MHKIMVKALGIFMLALLIMSTTGAASAYSSHGYNHGYHHNWNNFKGVSPLGCHNPCNGNTSNGNDFFFFFFFFKFLETPDNGNCCGNTSSDNSGVNTGFNILVLTMM